MIKKFELKWDIITLYGMQTIKWPYPPVAGVWGRWWPDLLAQKKPGPGGTGQGEAPRAVQTWRLPSSKAATFGDDYLIKAPVPYFVKFLPKFFDKKYILAIFTPQKTYTRLFKRDGYSTTHAMFVWIFSCPTTTRRCFNPQSPRPPTDSAADG